MAPKKGYNLSSGGGGFKAAVPKNDFGGGGGNPINNLAAAIAKQSNQQQLDREARAEAQKQIPGGILTKASGENVTTESPENIGKVKAAEEQAQMEIQNSPNIDYVSRQFKVLKQLADTVPTTEPGIRGIIKGSQTSYKGATSQIPQLSVYEGKKNSVLSIVARSMRAEKGNLAEGDVQRVSSGFGNLAFHTPDTKALTWDLLIDDINDTISSRGYKTIVPLDKRQILSPAEIGRSRVLRGMSNFEDLNNEELTGATEGDLKVIPIHVLQALREEGKKRRLI